MKYLLIILLLLSKLSYAQQWHYAIDTLKYPINELNGEVSYGWYNRYDTIPCKCINIELKEIPCFKKFYLYKGMFIDDSITMHVFFDNKMNRLTDIMYYKFK